MNAVDGYGRAAIHYAAERDVTCLEMLLTSGADPNIPDGNQDTALHWAAFKNKARCVKVCTQSISMIIILLALIFWYHINGIILLNIHVYKHI